MVVELITALPYNISSLRGKTVVKNLINICVVMLFLAGSVHPSLAAVAKSYVYKDYKTETGKIVEKDHKIITKKPSGEIQIQRKLEGENYNREEEYVLDPDYATRNWSIKWEDEDTDYNGHREGNVLYIKGRMEGRPVNKRIELDDRPFYNHPKVNFTEFVLSDKNFIEFFGLRKSTLAKYVMEAKKTGEETITINGRPVDIIKVFLSPKGLYKKFYRRTYYFRKSDGLFVKKKPTKGRSTELIFEK